MAQSVAAKKLMDSLKLGLERKLTISNDDPFK